MTPQTLMAALLLANADETVTMPDDHHVHLFVDSGKAEHVDFRAATVSCRVEPGPGPGGSLHRSRMVHLGLEVGLGEDFDAQDFEELNTVSLKCRVGGIAAGYKSSHLGEGKRVSS